VNLATKSTAFFRLKLTYTLWIDDPLVTNKAQKLLFEDVLPKQGMVIDLFMQIIDRLDDDIQKSTTEVHKKYHSHEQFQYIYSRI